MGYPDFDFPDPSATDISTLPRRDLDVYAAIVALLESTSVFDRVILAAPENLDTAVSTEGSIAVVVPSGGEEWDDSGPKRIRRVGRYHLVVKTRQEEFVDGYSGAEVLANTARNALSRVALGGFCVPQYTTLQQDAIDTTDHPNACVGLRGSFLYIVRPFAGGRKTEV